MPDAFRNWARRHTPALATLYLLLLALISAGSWAILFEWRGSGRVIGRIEQWSDRIVKHRESEWETRRLEAGQLFAKGEIAAAEQALLALLADIPIKSRLGPDGQIRRQSLQLLVDVYLAQGKRENAVRVCNVLLMMNPDYAEETCLYGKTLIAAGEKEEGERQLLKSIELDPNHTPAVEFLIPYFAEQARLKEVVEVYDRYENAFSMARGMQGSPRQGAVYLASEHGGIARIFLPVLHEFSKEHFLPLGELPPFADPDWRMDRWEIFLTLPPECGFFEIERVRLLPRRVIGRENPDPLLEITDFSAALPQETAPASFSERAFELRVPLPFPVRLGDVDAIAVQVRAGKRLSDTARAIVERARIQVEQERSRHAP